MAADDEVARFIFNVQGHEDLGRAAKQLRDLNDQFRAGTITQAQFDMAAKPVALQAIDLTRKIQAQGGAVHNLNTAILQGSYAIQDFASAQGGLAQKIQSVSNNIPIILANLGMSGGIAGALSLIAVGAGAIIQNWDSLFGEKPAANAKEIADQVKRAAEEMKKFLALKSQAAGVDKQERAENLQANLSGQQGKIVQGAANVIGGAEATDLQSRIFQVSQRAERFAGGAAAGGIYETEQFNRARAREKELRRQLNAALVRAKTEAQKLVKAAMMEGDPKAFQRIRGMMGEHPDQFTEEQRFQFEQEAPETKEAEEQFDADLRKRSADIELRNARRAKEKKWQKERTRRQLDDEEQTRLKNQGLTGLERSQGGATAQGLVEFGEGGISPKQARAVSHRAMTNQAQGVEPGNALMMAIRDLLGNQMAMEARLAGMDAFGRQVSAQAKEAEARNMTQANRTR